MGTSATRHYTLSLHDALPIFPELSARTKACTAQKPACCILPWVQAHPEIKKPDRHKRPGFGFTLPCPCYFLAKGSGIGVLLLDGGRIGIWKLGCSPVNVFMKAVILSISSFSSLRPSCRRAITSTASSSFQ